MTTVVCQSIWKRKFVVTSADLRHSPYDEETWHLNSSNSWALSGESVAVVGHFENATVNNHWRPIQGRKGTGMVDIGSNWTNFQSTFKPSSEYVHSLHYWNSSYYGYKGPLIVHDWRQFYAEDFIELIIDFCSSEPTLYSLGSTAISRVLPTNPISDLPTGLAELYREGFPKVPGSRATRGRGTSGNFANNYLNYEFGIRPFLSDLRDFQRAVTRSEKIVNDYAERANKKLRRRYEFTPVHEVSRFVHPTDDGFNVVIGGPISHFMTPAGGGWPGERVDVITRTKTTWFSGAFVYYLPSAGNDFSSKLLRQEAELRHLYGGISVDTAWNLLPYSWLVDWRTNAGDVIHNVAAFARDGLVMPHGYIMESCERHDVRTVTGAVMGGVIEDPGHDPLYVFPPSVTTEFGAKYKRRRKATPYGFGLDTDEFTTRQKSILAAIGISLSRK